MAIVTATRSELLVVALPEGATRDEPGRGGEILRDLPARAVGCEFTFDPDGSTR